VGAWEATSTAAAGLAAGAATGASGHWGAAVAALSVGRGPWKYRPGVKGGTL
jgi:hypothetical protein